MTNKYEHRLHQIELLLRAYTTNGEASFTDEVNELKKERDNILDLLIDDRLLKE